MYERNGVTVSSFPAIHALNGALGYKIEYAGSTVVFSGDTRSSRHVVDAAAGADLLIHECFQSPAVMAQAIGMEEAMAENLIKLAHTVPDQAGQIFEMTQPRMAALWHLDLRPGVDRVFAEITAHYSGAVVASQDLTVYNVTPEAVVARQAQLDPAAPVLKEPTGIEPPLDEPNVSPEWWQDAILDL